MEMFVNKRRTSRGFVLEPAHEQDAELVAGLPVTPLRVTVRRVRNYQFHRKFFALLNFAFDCWEPQTALADARPYPIEKNFERFRKDIIILAGFFDASYRVDGSVRLEAKSIAFHAMDEDEFAALYDKVIDVIVKHVLTNYDGDELRAVVDEVMAFA